MKEVMEIAGYLLVTVGVLFLFLGALGIFRMPDVFTRLQAGTKATTLGGMGTIIGIGLLQPEWFWKLFIIAVFIAISNPISSHALARGTYKQGVRPYMKEEGLDDYEKVQEEGEKEE